MSLGDALDGTGVRRDDLTTEARVPVSAALRLLERAATLSGCPHLGLLVGARSDHRVLGLVGTMMSHAQTLGDALRDYVAVQLGYSRGATVYLQPMGADDILGYGLYDRAAPDSLQLYDLGAAAGCNFVRSLTGGRARGARVLLSRSTPPETAPDVSLLKMPVAFDQEQTGVVISAADMTTSPLPGANAAEHWRLIARICELMGSDIDDIAARVQHILRPRLLLGEGDRAEVARELGLNGRTCARRLAVAETSFEDIKDDVRFAVARDLLSLTGLPVGQISTALSYATPSAFNHALQRWTGTTPPEWRAAQGARSSGWKQTERD